MEKENPKYIPGIYNYCDRWCERCQFRTQCLNYKIDNEQRAAEAREQDKGDLQQICDFQMRELQEGGCKENRISKENDDRNTEVFWDRFTAILQKTFIMVKEMALQRGIHIYSGDGESEKELDVPIKTASLVHLICYMAKAYAKLIDDWLSYQSIILNRDDELNPIPNPDPEGKSLKETDRIKDVIRDALQVIKWYQYQINVKLKRAITSAERENSTHLEIARKDSDGSAKVALIGIDRSINAWNVLLKQFPEQGEKILKFIAFLKNLRKRVETEFPKARNFIRPGFDK